MGESQKQAFQPSFNRFLRGYCQVKQFGGILAARRHR